MNPLAIFCQQHALNSEEFRLEFLESLVGIEPELVAIILFIGLDGEMVNIPEGQLMSVTIAKTIKALVNPSRVERLSPFQKRYTEILSLSGLQVALETRIIEKRLGLR